VGYLSGSIPFALLLGRLRGVDIRTVGSGNVGATNLGRACGKPWGIGCFVLDMTKGLAPVLVAGGLLGYLGQADLPPADAWRWLSVGAAAVFGHVFPVWLKFRGGKGVATGAGVLLGFWPVLTVPGLLGAAVWGGIVAASRYVGVASVVAALSLPLWLLIISLVDGHALSARLPFFVVSGLLAALVTFRHRGNIARTLAGTEPKIGQKRQTA